jgi:predicted nuclease of predicted toxin-antitoxin system
VARFLLDVHVSSVLAAVLESAGHSVLRASHGASDPEVVQAALDQEAILVTFNRAKEMSRLLRQGPGAGLRAFVLVSLNQLRRTTRLRLDTEFAETILRLWATPGPFLCFLGLDERRHHLVAPVFLAGGPDDPGQAR